MPRDALYREKVEQEKQHEIRIEERERERLCVCVCVCACVQFRERPSHNITKHPTKSTMMALVTVVLAADALCFAVQKLPNLAELKISNFSIDLPNREVGRLALISQTMVSVFNHNVANRHAWKKKKSNSSNYWVPRVKLNFFWFASSVRGKMRREGEPV